MDLGKQFNALKKSKNNFDCLVFEMLLIRQMTPSLNVQSDSIRAKLFAWHSLIIIMLILSELYDFDSLFLSLWAWKWCHDDTETLFNFVICFYIVIWLVRVNSPYACLHQTSLFHQQASLSKCKLTICITNNIPKPQKWQEYPCALSMHVLEDVEWFHKPRFLHAYENR